MELFKRQMAEVSSLTRPGLSVPTETVSDLVLGPGRGLQTQILEVSW